MKKLLSIFLVLILSLSFAACGQPASAPQAAAPKSGDIVVLFTGDVHCGIDQGFGYSGLYALRLALMEDNHVLLADTGDAIQGEPVGAVTKGDAVIDLMNQVGYDVAIPGNHEFDYGMEHFLALTKNAAFPYVSVNFAKEDAPVFAPYIIKSCGDVDVAFLGVSTPDTLISSTPTYFQDENGNYIYSFLQDGTGERLYAAVQKAVDDARANGAEYVVALTHLGNQEALAPYTYADLIANTSGIDAVLDGHSHDTDQVTMKNKAGKDVLRSAAGTKLGSIGCLRIAADGTLTTQLYTWDNGVLPTALFGIQNPVDEAVAAVTEDFDKALGSTVATTQTGLVITDPTALDAEGQPLRIVRSQETNLGDLCADAFRDQSGADIAFMNGGGIRAEIGAGDITLKDLLSVHPYGNSLCVVEVSGQTILDALEWGARAMPGESGGFLQVSGLSYTVDISVKSPCIADENGSFSRISGARRVKDVRVDSVPIDPGKTYTLASHNYMLKSGGDGYTMFQGARLLQNEVKPDHQVLIDYICGTLGGTVGGAYAQPYGQGRITITPQ